MKNHKGLNAVNNDSRIGAKEHRPERSDNFLLTPQSKLLKLEKYDLVYDEKRINYFC